MFKLDNNMYKHTIQKFYNSLKYGVIDLSE